MIEKVKKGPRNYCVTVLFLLLLNGITSFTKAEFSQNSLEGETKPEEMELTQEEVDDYIDDQNYDEQPEETSQQSSLNLQRRINSIIVHGNASTATDAVLNNIPYKIGELFDPRKTKTLIRNLYYNLKKFRTIKVMGEPLEKNYMNLHVIVEEKYPLKEIKSLVTKKYLKKKLQKK